MSADNLGGWQARFRTLRSIAWIVALALLIRASIVEAFKIPSGSMMPTLVEGDHLLVWKLTYGLRLPLITRSVWQFSMPARGDIVVFTRPDDPSTAQEDESDTNLVKRVVGLPGDTITIQGAKVYINGSLYTEDYSVWVLGGRHNFETGTIPPGKVFLLGDNRDQSKDSRFWNEPLLDARRIKGRAFVIYWSWPEWDRTFTILR